MRQAVSTRQSNIDATLDARDDQVSKTNQRAVSRSQRIPGRVLAYIAWNLTGAGVDTSQGVICDENGNSTLATIQIDAIASIVNCQPQSFGYALYEVTIVGTRSNAPTYAATKVSSIAPAAGLGTAKALGSLNSSYQLLDTTGALIQVTVGGAATNSILPAALPGGGTGSSPATFPFNGPLSYVATSSLNQPVNLAPAAAVAYGIVNWKVLSGGSAVDQSVAELTNADGSRIASPTVVYIEYLSSIRPQAFGNIAYKLELIGVATRSSVTGPIYRAIEVIGSTLAAGTAARTFTVGSVSTDSNSACLAFGLVGNAAASYIFTQISGGNVGNYMGLLSPFTLTTNDVVDLPSPLSWALSGTYSGVSWICLVPTIGTNRQGGVLTATPTFDHGEVVVIHFWGTYTRSGASFASSIMGVLIVQVSGAPAGVARGLDNAYTSTGPGPATWSSAVASGTWNMGSFVTGTVAFTASGGTYYNPVVTLSSIGGVVSVFAIVGGRGPLWAGVG